MDEDSAPSQITPHNAQGKRTVGDRLRQIKKKLTTRQGLLGDYDYGFLFTPNLPFMKRPAHASPFFGLHDRMPVVLALLLGFQHSLAMLAGVITPPLLLSGAAGVNLDVGGQQYLVSTALIVSGLLTAVQITRFHIYKTPYYIGTGLISVVGISFTIIPIAQGAFAQMYANGFCPTSPTGVKLPCPDAYGAVLGTCAVCALVEILIAFIPPKIMLKIFPPIVTGPTVMLIGVYLIKSGFRNWAGGSGPCSDAVPTAFFASCPNINAPHALAWGSPEYLGLGFSVFVTIILCERFGSPIMKSTSVILGLLVGCIIAGATGYFDPAGIKAAPAASFVWVRTFKLSVYPPLVLPVIALFIIVACEAIGDITATCDVSRIEVQGKLYESRIQGGVLADGLAGVLAAMMTMTPMSCFAQNNGVIALTRCANRTAGYCCCFFLIVMGIFAKFAAALVAIPAAVLGGMTTFLFCAVAVSGISIITKGVPFTRRNRFILTAALTLGYGATLVPNYFSRVFASVDTTGSNSGLAGLLDAIELIMSSGFALTAFITMILNLTLPEEVEEAGSGEGVVTTGQAAGAPAPAGVLAVEQQQQKGLDHSAGPVPHEGPVAGGSDSMDSEEKYKRV